MLVHLQQMLRRSDSYDWNGITYTASGSYTFTTTDASGCDSTATLNLTINNASSSTTDVTVCDSYDWNGITYTASGSYTFTTTNASGCDSTATLNLTINNATSSTTDVTACDSYDWNSATYTASGSYTFTTTNASGCDSTATLNLTINNATSSTTDVTACDSYDWNGSTYTAINRNASSSTTDVVWVLIVTIGTDYYSTLITINNAIYNRCYVRLERYASGSYTFTTTNASGCDSTATLNLTINNASSSTTDVTACDSYDWNGITYTASGSYTFTTTNASGCDSTATLNLTINNATSSTTDVTACDSYDWNGTTYTASGSYTFTTTNASGCDSTATLRLTKFDVTALTINNASSQRLMLLVVIVQHRLTMPMLRHVIVTIGTVLLILLVVHALLQRLVYSTATLNLTINNATSSTTDVTACDSYDWNGITYTASGSYTFTTTNASGCDSNNT